VTPAYLLDTEHLSVLEKGVGEEFAQLQRRMRAVGIEAFCVSIVSFQEQIAGWMADLNRFRTQKEIVRGYAMLEKIIARFHDLPILPFDAAASDEFMRLRKLKVRVATLDLRIAASAIVHQKVVLTSNTVDFEAVPGVRCEDWTV